MDQAPASADDGDRFRPDDGLSASGEVTGRAPSISGHLLVGAFFATALLLISIDPRIATIVPCVFAARETLRSGWWLWWHDGDRVRARLCFGFYMALAIWQAAASAFGSLMVYLIIQMALGLNPPLDPILAVLMLFMFGLFVSSAVAVVMALTALVCRRKVWLNPLVFRDCQGDPRRLSELQGLPRRINLGFLMLSTSFGLVLAIATIIPVVTLLGPAPGQPPQNGPAGFWFLVGLLTGIVVSAVGTMSMCEKLAAKSPRECWAD